MRLVNILSSPLLYWPSSPPEVTLVKVNPAEKALSSGPVTFQGQILIKGINTLLQAKTHMKPVKQIKMNSTLSSKDKNELQQFISFFF